jgi:hypothetical protein
VLRLGRFWPAEDLPVAIKGRSGSPRPARNHGWQRLHWRWPKAVQPWTLAAGGSGAAGCGRAEGVPEGRHG